MASSTALASCGPGLQSLLAEQLDALLKAVAYNELIVREFTARPQKETEEQCEGTQELHEYPSAGSSSSHKLATAISAEICLCEPDQLDADREAVAVLGGVHPNTTLPSALTLSGSFKEGRSMPLIRGTDSSSTAAMPERACHTTASSSSITLPADCKVSHEPTMHDADNRESAAVPDIVSGDAILHPSLPPSGSSETNRWLLQNVDANAAALGRSHGIHDRLPSDASACRTEVGPGGQGSTYFHPSKLRSPGSSKNGLREPLLVDAHGDAAATVLDSTTPKGFTGRRGVVFRGMTETRRQVTRTLSSTHESLGGETIPQEMRAGFWADTVQDKWFQTFMIILIILNSLWIGVVIDHSKEDVTCGEPPAVQAVDNVFCICFLFEIVARLLALKIRCNAFLDMWFVFDSSLVLLMVGETWLEVAQCLISARNDGGHDVKTLSVLRILRIFRLLRVARLSRLFRAIPELRVLANAMTAGLRAMLVTLSMLIIIIYIMSLLFTQMLRGTKVALGRFETVPQSASFMLSQILCGFDSGLLSKLAEEGFVLYVLWVLYILVGSLVLLNILTGILCEAVSSTADGEFEVAAQQDLEAEVAKLDVNGDGSVSQEEHLDIVNSPGVMQQLQDKDVDVSALLEFAQFVFDDCPVMSTSDFVEMVMQFRGSKTVTVKDIVDMRKFITMEVTYLKDLFLNEISGHSRETSPTTV